MVDLEDAKQFVQEKTPENMGAHCKTCGMGLVGIVCCGGVFLGTIMFVAYMQYAHFENQNK
jgi:hypothetical protein